MQEIQTVGTFLPCAKWESSNVWSQWGATVMCPWCAQNPARAVQQQEAPPDSPRLPSSSEARQEQVFAAQASPLKSSCSYPGHCQAHCEARGMGKRSEMPSGARHWRSGIFSGLQCQCLNVTENLLEVDSLLLCFGFIVLNPCEDLI